MSIPLSNLKIACILDEFSYECFRHECTLIKVGTDDWNEIINKECPHLLLVESAWRGNDFKWRYKLGDYKNNTHTEIKDLTSYCKKLGIPTVFWNKEDPVHFNFYLKAASLFDYVFTTDENCIDEYKRKLGHDRVFTLPFAAQPKIHNPIRVPGYRSKNVCFAGTYYGNHHRDRTIDMDLLLRTASRYGLEIFDRNHHLKTNYRYPYTYRRFVKGYLPYDQLVNVSKQFKVCLNVNSVKSSPTMCARRVFELLASGITVLSNDSKAMGTLFDDTVLISKDRRSIQQALLQGIYNDEWRAKHELKGMRLVYNNHTYAHRLYQIASTCGLNIEQPSEPTIQVVAYASTGQEVNTIIHAYNEQKYPYKQLTIFVEKKAIDTKMHENRPDIQFLKSNKLKFHPKKILKKHADYLAIFNPSHYYGPYYLTDLVLATHYAKAKIIGKGSYFSFNPSIILNNETHIYSYIKDISTDASIIHHSVFDHTRSSLSDLLNNQLQLEQPITTFSINPFNFFYNYFKSEKIVPTMLNRING